MTVENNQGQEESCAEYYFKKFAENGILQNIFSRVVCRRQLALVNKLFYKTVCKLDSIMNIYRARFEQDQIVWKDGCPKENIYQSVFCSYRVLTEILICKVYLVDIVGDSFEANYQQSEFLLSNVLKNMSGCLRKFSLLSCLMTESQLMTILDSINNSSLKEINIVEGAIIHENMRHFNKALIFPSLVKLDLSKTKYGNPDPDESICENNEMYWFLKSIAENSPLMEDLSIHESFVKIMSIGNFKLKRLYVEKASPVNVRLAQVISLHTNSITSVDFLNCYVMEDVLNEILQAPNLSSLKINMDGISLRGFINISKLKTLTELGLKCSNSCKWIKNALSMHTLDSVKKFYLDIKNLDVNYYELSKMLNKNIPHIHLVASQHYVFASLFESTFVGGIKTCTVELYIDPSESKKIKVEHCIVLDQLKQLTIINRNTEFYNFEFDLNVILDKCLFLEKLRIEGFEVNSKLFEIAINGHFHLEELYLINPKNAECEYVFDKQACEPITVYGKKLKILEISCAKSKLKRSRQFPVMTRRGSLKILRHR